MFWGIPYYGRFIIFQDLTVMKVVFIKYARTGIHLGENWRGFYVSEMKFSEEELISLTCFSLLRFFICLK